MGVYFSFEEICFDAFIVNHELFAITKKGLDWLGCKIREWYFNKLCIYSKVRFIYESRITCNHKIIICFRLAWPQLTSPSEIPAEAKATPVFLLRISSSTCTCTCTLIQDSIPKLQIDFLNNHYSDLTKIWNLKILCLGPQHDVLSVANTRYLLFFSVARNMNGLH